MLTISQLAERLKEVDDLAWGMYAFSREPLNHRLSEQTKRELTVRAVACGRETAKRSLAAAGLTAGNTAPRVLAAGMKLNIETGYERRTGDRILFASFTCPDTITIMAEPLTQAYTAHGREFPVSEKQSVSLLLGHELFHYLETLDRAIFTRTQKMLHRRFLGLNFYRPINAVSEIAAMYFAKHLTGFPYSPFMLDLLLYYPYNQAAALRMYEELCCYEEGCRQ